MGEHFDCKSMSVSTAQSPSPADVTRAIHLPNFEHDANAFWDLCNFLMKNYTNPNGSSAPVWKQIPSAVETARKLAKKMSTVLERTQIEDIDQRQVTIFNTYVITIAILRGNVTVTEWMAHEDVDVLKALSCIYGTLTQVKARQNKLMGITFGQLPN